MSRILSSICGIVLQSYYFAGTTEDAKFNLPGRLKVTYSDCAFFPDHFQVCYGS